MKHWRYKLNLTDIWKNESMSFPELRDEIVRRIRAAEWFDLTDWILVDIVEWLEATETICQFDEAWDHFYNWCDEDKRVWVETMTT